MKHTLLSGPHSIVPLLWIIFTTVVAIVVMVPFRTDSPCRIDEETSECHGRRFGEGIAENFLVFLLVIVGWVIITFLIPRLVLRRRANHS